MAIEIIRGYEILEPFRIVGGGQSRWTFARKGTKEYFIKQFLSPTYPTPESPGSERAKSFKLAQCQRFENFHQDIMHRLKPLVADGGNLVVTKDFFRDGAKYYKVTEKVDTASIRIEEISSLPIDAKLLVLRSVAHSLRILHGQNLVHGDLKPNNILIKRTTSGFWATKLIDFDNCFVAGHPPEDRDEMVGDPAFYSPEMADYVRGESMIPSKLPGLPSDIFALGLVYWIYLTGALPSFDRDKYSYAWMAAQDGYGWHLSSHRGVPTRLAELIEQMLSVDPADRLEIGAVMNVLKSDAVVSSGPRTIVPPATASTLKGSLLSGARTSDAPGEATGSSPKLKGDLVRKKEK